MKLCFLADARSAIAQNWVRYFIAEGHEVHVISSYPCDPDALPGAASLRVAPVAFSGLVGNGIKGNGTGSVLSFLVRRLRSGGLSPVLSAARHWLGPFDVFRCAGQVRCMIEGIKPDLVHAMRIPFEGMLAAEALRKAKMPLLLSVWGNDFTLFAEGYPLVALLTRRALTRADALHTDCHRDLRLAHRWGFDVARSEIVLPGSGGVQGQVFRPGPANAAHRAVPQGAPVILNSRGFRGYVRNDTFFRSIPLVLEQRPEAVFFGVAMQGNPIAERWVRELGIASAVRLLPAVRRPEMAELFRLADVTVSPSEHDGTPNTLLEAMACGCFPVAGDIESVREWIEDGVNGLLCDPASPESLAQAILRALNDSDLRQRARQHNVELIAERAEYGSVMAQAEQFYRRIVEFASSERRQG